MSRAAEGKHIAVDLSRKKRRQRSLHLASQVCIVLHLMHEQRTEQHLAPSVVFAPFLRGPHFELIDALGQLALLGAKWVEWGALLGPACRSSSRWRSFDKAF